jgi:hypothetical protein
MKGNHNYIRLYLNKGTNGNFMVITHEQGVLTKFPWFELIRTNFWEFFIIFVIKDN